MQLSVREVAHLLSLSEDEVYRLIKLREIPHMRVNDQHRFNRAELLEWATERGYPIAPEVFQEARADFPSSLCDSLSAGGALYGIEGDAPEDVFREIVSKMPLPESADRDFLSQLIVARENLGSTGLGGGIAVPHPQNPIVLDVPTPLITLSFLQKPIDFKAIDSKPVDVLFVIVSPTARGHLHLLSRLAFCLRDAKVKGLLAAKAPFEEILKAFVEREAMMPPQREEN